MSDDFFDDVPAVPSAVPAVREKETFIQFNGTKPPQIMMAQLFFDSGLFPNARNVGGVFTIVQYGREVGLSPVVALNSVAIINGKLSMSGASMLALAFKHGVKATIVEESDKICTIFFQRDGYPDYTSTFTIEDAEQAELLKQENGRIKHEGWRKYPAQMLRWRAVSKGLKVVAPDIMAGVYTEEELESVDSIQNNTYHDVTTVDGCAEKDTPPPAPDVSPGQAPQQVPARSDKITDGQSRMLHTLMSERGIIEFKLPFKDWLIGFPDNGMDPEKPSSKDLNKKFMYDLIGQFKQYATQFLACSSYRPRVISIFEELKPESKNKVVAAVKTLIADADWFKLDPAELNDQKLCDLFALILSGIENQEHNRIASMVKDGGVSVDQAIDALQDMGMEPSVVSGTKINETKKEKPVQQEDMLPF